MKLPLSPRAEIVLAIAAPIATAAIVLACSDSSSNSSGSSSSCDSEDLTVLFTPKLYSAHDGEHTFQVPAMVEGVKATTVTWSLADSSVADLTKDTSTGGILLTPKKAGTTKVIAKAGSLCGTTTLEVTEAASDDWEVGNQRYNNGIVLRPPAGAPGSRDGGAEAGGPVRDVACTNCHGPTANGAFKDVAHTPQQTGGFSDDELQNIFRNGVVPDGGYFDESIVPYRAWQGFHKWEMTDEQAKGIIVYLRGLTPEPQEGASNFGGRFPDGGRPPGPPPGG